MVLVWLGATLGIGGWLAVSLMTASSIWRFGTWPGPYALEMTLAILAYVIGVAMFSWGWELGVAGRALRVAILLGIAGIAIWVIIAVVALVLVAMFKSDGNGGGGSGGSGGSGSTGDHGIVAGIGRTVDAFVSGGGPLPGGDSPLEPMACTSCGFTVDPNTMRLCPRCSTPLPGA
jgi:hypothetical protein